MTEDDQKELFALSKKDWESSTEEQKLTHIEKYETEITLAFSDNDPEDAGFEVLDWNYLQAHKDEINLDLDDQDKLTLFDDEAEDLIELIENDTGEEILSDKYEDDNFSDQEKLGVVNDYLSRYGIERISSWMICYKLDENMEREYKLEIANYFYSSWYVDDYLSLSG